MRATVHEQAPQPGVGTLPASRVSVDEADLIRVARRLAEVTLALAPGAWDPRSAPAAARDGFTVMLLEGLMVREVHLGAAPAAHLVIGGDTLDALAPHDAVLCGERVTWRALEESTLAVLGPRFLAATRRFPALTVALHRLQTRQSDRALRHAAVAQLPRVDDRIVGLLRGLAEERGRVVVDGVVVDLPVNHGGIGRLIGAKRPTVSLALKALAEAQLVTRRGTQWLIGPAATGLAEPAVEAGTLAA